MITINQLVSKFINHYYSLLIISLVSLISQCALAKHHRPRVLTKACASPRDISPEAEESAAVDVGLAA